MTQSRPPDKVFCMQCGPEIALVADERPALTMHCPVCRTRAQRSDRPLFVVAGVSGAGKTAVTPALRQLLPGCEVFDVDLTLHIAALGWETWRNTWLQIAGAIGLNGRSTVLCGTLAPEQLADLPARELIGPIHFCLLDAPHDVIAARLRDRPTWRGSTEKFIHAQQGFAAMLRVQISPQFDTSVLNIGDTAAAIAAWINPLLEASSCGQST